MKQKIVLYTFLLLTLTVISCTNSAQLEEQMTMDVGYLPVLVNLPLFVALEEGYFEKYNLDVTVHEAQSPNHVMEAIVAGNLDGAGILAFPLLFAAQEKYPGEFKIFATTDETKEGYVASLIVSETSDIASIEDLKGKKIGVYTGIVQVLFLKSIIAGMGFDPEKDVEIIQIAPRLQLQGLESGQYEVLSTVEPFPTIAKSKNIGKVFLENPRVKYIQDPFPSVATPLSTDFIEENPETAKAFLLAYRDAVSFIQQHPEQAKQHLTKYTPITADIASEVTLPRFNQFGEEDRDNIQRYADWMHSEGLLSKQINTHAMFGDVIFS